MNDFKYCTIKLPYSAILFRVVFGIYIIFLLVLAGMGAGTLKEIICGQFSADNELPTITNKGYYFLPDSELEDEFPIKPEWEPPIIKHRNVGHTI